VHNLQIGLVEVKRVLIDEGVDQVHVVEKGLMDLEPDLRGQPRIVLRRGDLLVDHLELLIDIEHQRLVEPEELLNVFERKLHAEALSFGASGHPQDPTFQFRDPPLLLRQRRVGVLVQQTPPIRLKQPLGDRIRRLLVDRPVLLGVPVSEDRRVHLDEHRLALGHIPTIEGPEMHPVADLPSNRPQPRDTGVRGVGDPPFALEPEDTLPRRGPQLDEADLVAAAGPGRVPVPDEVHVGVRLVGRPVDAEVVEELVPALELVLKPA
jgi:hypothetical protein